MKQQFWPALGRFAVGVVLAGLALQLYFAGRVALMAVVAPESTAFERSEVYRLATTLDTPLKWSQSWTPYPGISDHLKRAVIASEDSAFAEHDGVDIEAMEKAWGKNAKAEEKANNAANQPPPKYAKPQQAPKPAKPPKIIGGSTITQQLAKNLFLSGERTLLRKGQELVVTLALEAFLDKERILELYLNHVEWGQGVFGAEAAAQHYFRKSADQLSAYESARLAVMLPRPKYFETRANSGYLSSRASTIAARMGSVELP